MKRLVIFASTLIALTSFFACNTDNDDWGEYAQWIKDNQQWYEEMKALRTADGDHYYSRLSPAWFSSSGVLIHYFNDRSKTEGNLSPLVTSWIDVKYIGYLYDGTAFDSSYTQTTYGDSIFRTQLSGTIPGWQVALTDMRVGDSCEVIIPFGEAYGSQSSGSIPAYSTLRFLIKLQDIYKYEIGN